MQNIQTQFEKLQEESLYFLLSNIIKECKAIFQENAPFSDQNYTLEKIGFHFVNKKSSLNLFFASSHSQYLKLTHTPTSYTNEESAKRIEKLISLINSPLINETLYHHFLTINQENNDRPIFLSKNSENNQEIRSFLGEKNFHYYENEHLENIINEEPKKIKN